MDGEEREQLAPWRALVVTPEAFLRLDMRVSRLEDLHESKGERSLSDALDSIRGRLSQLEGRLGSCPDLPCDERNLGTPGVRPVQGRHYYHWLGDLVVAED